MANKEQLYILGLDGADISTLQFWLDRGTMPNLNKLIKKSALGKTNSTIPPVTAPAWNSFLTGCNPGKHGIYDFVYEDRTTGKHLPIDSNCREIKSIYNYLNEANYTSIFLNMPSSYPTEETNGLIVSGFLTPDGVNDYFSDQSMQQEIEDQFGKYPLCFKTPAAVRNSSKSMMEIFIKECLEETQYKFDVAKYLIKKIDPNLFFVHLFGHDQICHVYWHLWDKKHKHYNDKQSDRLLPIVEQYYRELDQRLGDFLETTAANKNLIIMSDHGFGSWNKTIFLNTWLLKQGFIKIKKNPLSQLKYLAWSCGITHENLYRLLLKPLLKVINIKNDIPYNYRLQSFYNKTDLLLTRKDIDWKQTQAVCNMSFGQIFLRKKDLYQNGCVTNDQREKIIKKIAEGLSNFIDPETGKKISGDIHISDECYQGDLINQMPDITYLPLEEGVLATAVFGFDSNKEIVDSFAYSGVHRQHGIFIGSGPDIESNQKDFVVDLQDFLPSILNFFNIKSPNSIDGKSFDNLFKKDITTPQINIGSYKKDSVITESNRRYLKSLEEESIYIIREARATFKNPALLWSIGKDSTTMLWLARKAFLGNIPFPILHIDTTYKFPEIYTFRDHWAKKWNLDLVIGRNEEAIEIERAKGFENKLECCHQLKTMALKQTIKKYGFDALILGIRRDEHGIRSKERVFSPRKENFSWDYQNQPAELWNHYQSKDEHDDHMRIHPILHMTELNIWQYIALENIPVCPLYFAKGNQRYRSIGCHTCCSPVESQAANISSIIKELETTTTSERSGRAQDKESIYTMQKLRSLGYM